MSSAIRYTAPIVAPKKGRKGASGPIAEATPHPATAITRTYDDDEMDFMLAVDAFKTRTGRRFPTLADYLYICKLIGFSRPVSAPSAGTPSKAKGR